MHKWVAYKGLRLIYPQLSVPNEGTSYRSRPCHIGLRLSSVVLADLISCALYSVVKPWEHPPSLESVPHRSRNGVTSSWLYLNMDLLQCQQGFTPFRLFLPFAQIQPLQFVQCARVFRLRGLPCLCVRRPMFYHTFLLFASNLPHTAFLALGSMFIWFRLSWLIRRLFAF